MTFPLVEHMYWKLNLISSICKKSYDRLTFYDGIDSSYKRLGKSYTGTVHPDVIYSTGRHMFVDFSVEEKYLLEGWGNGIV